MKVDVPYDSLTHTLKCIKLQVIDSLPYISTYLPDYINTPEQLFKYLRSKVNYKKDPQGVELLQMAQTLLDRGGFGDCDCFTILSLTALKELGFCPLYVTIVGNSRLSPTHIYAEVYDRNEKQIIPFDLTNPEYGMERPYKFKQRLLFKI